MKFIYLKSILFNLLLFQMNIFGITYYVNKAAGNDSNPGTEALPFATISKAASLIVGGDRVNVLTGDYDVEPTYDKRVQIYRSGSAGNPVIFNAMGNVKTRGFKVNADYIHIIGFEMIVNGVEIKEGHYCQILNNVIHDVGYVGVDLVTKPSFTDNNTNSNCIVKNNLISYAVKCGIRVMGQNHIIEGNDISHTLRCSPYSTYCDDADGIRFFGSGHLIKKNYIHDIMQEPENYNDPHIDFFQTWQSARNIIFEQNLCTSSNTSGSNQIAMITATSGVVENLTFRNNVFIMSDPGWGPLNINQTNSEQTIDNIIIVNNLFYHRNPQGLGTCGISLTRVQNALVKNNIFYNYGASNINYILLSETNQNIQIGNNNLYNVSNSRPTSGPYSNDLWFVDPKISNPVQGDYHLQPGSPCINAGDYLTNVTNDYYDKKRPLGNAYDIGPEESVYIEPEGPDMLRTVID